MFIVCGDSPNFWLGSVIDIPGPAGERVRAALALSGWHEDYRFDVRNWASELRSDGFNVNDGALRTLTRLGGLIVKPWAMGPTAFGSGPAQFDPIWAASGESERISEREGVVGTSLCPVGEWCGEYILLAGGDGMFYAETTFQFIRVGTDLIDTLRTIVLAEKIPIEL